MRHDASDDSMLLVMLVTPFALVIIVGLVVLARSLIQRYRKSDTDA